MSKRARMNLIHFVLQPRLHSYEEGKSAVEERKISAPRHVLKNTGAGPASAPQTALHLSPLLALDGTLFSAPSLLKTARTTS
jgi:hypothetical protein